MNDQTDAGGKRPMRPERVSYTQAWLYFLMIVCMLVAWWFPARMLFQHFAYFKNVPKVPRDAYVFTALAYGGISDLTNEVSVGLFKEHFAALRDAGYIAIGLEDVHALVVNGKPLPRKAVLMTFDQSRKSSYFDVRSVLREANWKAVMFLWTKPIVDEDPSALRWPYIREMVRSRFWEVGAQSHNGFAQVPADSSGRLGNYLTTPRWLADKNSYEPFEAFKTRIAEDHAQCIKLIRSGSRSKPTAYAYPYGDFGQFDERAIITRRLNLDFVGNYYDLGFIVGNLALNTRYSDRRRLNRLLVKPEWSGPELVARLSKAWPVRDGYASLEAITAPYSMIVDWGKTKVLTNRIDLFASQQVTGAKMWLNGSDLCRDFSAKIAFRVSAGQLGVFLRASSDEEEYMYLGLDRRAAWVRQKYAGLEPFTLASAPMRSDLNEVNELEIHLRDRVCFVNLNGQHLFKEHIAVHGQINPGMFGLSVWDPEKGKASAEIVGFSLYPQKPMLAEWTPRCNRGPYIAQWLDQNAYRLTHLSPPWINGARGGLNNTLPWDGRLFGLLAKTYNLKLMPALTIENLQWMEEVAPSNIIERAAALKADGLMINLAEFDSLAGAKAVPWLQEIGAGLQKKGLDLLVRFPQYLEKAVTLPAMLAVIPNLQVVALPGSPLLAADARQTNTTVSAESVPLPPDDLNLALYYEITGLAAKDDRMIPEVRAELLRQEGYAAFNAGNYAGALATWGKWHAFEPDNEEALMLMGDACLRMYDTPRAIDYYANSLAINPGQINLAIRRSRLIDESGKSDEAREILNLYARVFPGNVQVALAQAEWLNRHSRWREAMDIIRQVLSLHPNDISAIARLHGMLEKPADRYANMRRLLGVASQPILQYELGETIFQNDLMARPEFCVMTDFVERMSRQKDDPQMAQLYGRLLPLNRIFTENFSRSKLSPAWIVFGESTDDYDGQYRIKAHKTQMEVSLRLIGSDTMRNGFIEAGINDVKGFFWLYACRAGGNMIRFGFDQKGYIYLQVWQNGELFTNEMRPWQPPARQMRARLEIRADGATGLIDGKPPFSAPIQIQRDFGLGWWGLAPYSPKPGATHLALSTLTAGPLPVQLAILPGQVDEDGVLMMLKPYTSLLSAVCPSWFTQDDNGKIQKKSGSEEVIVRMFTRYNRLRLLPVINVSEEAKLNGSILAKLAAQNYVRGFVLMMRELPADEWFERLARELESAPLDILVMAIDDYRNIAEIREVNLGVGLFADGNQFRRVHVLTPTDMEIEEGEAQEALSDCVIKF
ncbi:MAG: polysaccharide deacetylase family protein [Verrucomicrobia bacterium]|nr:polysaccharide deacetylase family protein [Verrucomicrobiota bacterium]MBU1734737.1 polysaccharide deacetylase family protein [Verrucomicrobiota bacterium]MBU1857755.1 polysaccharide deacetylase family protein [Verrucomicrobiota bacterium]